MKKIIKIFLIVGVLITLFSACTSINKSSKNEIVFTALLHKTGFFSSFDKQMQEGMTLAIEEIKRDENVDIFLDIKDITNYDDGESLMKSFIDNDNVKVLIVTDDELINNTVYSLDERKTPILIDVSATYPPAPGNLENGIRIFLNGGQDMEELAKKAVEENLSDKRVVLLHTQDVYATTQAAYLKYLLEGENIRIYKDSFDPEEKNFDLLSQQVMRTEPEAFFIIGYGNNIEDICLSLENVNYKGKVFANVGYVQKKVPVSFKDKFITTSVNFDKNSTLSKEFVLAYKNKFEKEPSWQSALGYDKIKLLYLSYKKASKQVGLPMKEEFINLSQYNGALGKIKILKNGDVLFDISAK